MVALQPTENSIKDDPALQDLIASTAAYVGPDVRPDDLRANNAANVYLSICLDLQAAGMLSIQHVPALWRDSGDQADKICFPAPGDASESSQDLPMDLNYTQKEQRRGNPSKLLQSRDPRCMHLRKESKRNQHMAGFLTAVETLVQCNDFSLAPATCETVLSTGGVAEIVIAEFTGDYLQSVIGPAGDNFDCDAGYFSEAIAAILFPTDASEDANRATKAHCSTDKHFNSLGEALEEANYDKIVARLQANGVEVLNRRHKGPPSQNGLAGVAVPRFVVAQRSFTVVLADSHAEVLTLATQPYCSTWEAFLDSMLQDGVSLHLSRREEKVGEESERSLNNLHCLQRSVLSPSAHGYLRLDCHACLRH